MLGYRKDIPILLKSSNALLLPSEREGLPRSILEAMCAATPVIGTQIRGVEDLLENNHGLMTKVGDTKALAKAMTWIAQNPEAAQNMGKRGQTKMQAFSLENVINMHENLYAKMLNIEVHKEKEVVLR
jgi:glycosyltransferase involved in cell wall biosynthesis